MLSHRLARRELGCHTDIGLVLQCNLTVSQATLLKICYNLNLTGLASANKTRLVSELDAALMKTKEDASLAGKQPRSKAGITTLEGSTGQAAASEGGAGGDNGQAGKAMTGSPGKADGQKVKAWEASTPDAAIEAADSLGYSGLVKLTRVSTHSSLRGCDARS